MHNPKNKNPIKVTLKAITLMGLYLAIIDPII